MSQSGYFRFPTICGDQIIFVSEDDLWSTTIDGGKAVRLTNNLGQVSRPHLSPSGEQVAFVGREEGHTEVYCMDASGGPERRLTFLGAQCRVIGWNRKGDKILFTSNARQPFARIFKIYSISPLGGEPELEPYGLAHSISYSPNQGIVIGRNTHDPSTWKRYRGGTAGVLWIDREENGEFKPLLEVDGNMTSPLWVDSRIYFISDHEGMGRLYSSTPQGEDIREHASHEKYYLRNASTDGENIIFHAGGELYYYSPQEDKTHHIQFDYHSAQIERNRKFVSSQQYLEEYNLHPEGHSLLLTCRGKSYHLGNWEGATIQLGHTHGVRYRLTRWLNDGERFVTISDGGGEEALEIHSLHPNSSPERFSKIDIGRPVSLKVSPVEDKVALSNHRQELILIDLQSREGTVLDRSEFHRLGGFNWSPDGKWLVYSSAMSQQTFSLKLVHIDQREPKLLTPPRFRDVSPSFDPQGRFIYFLSFREFNPVYDSMYFDLNFPRGMRPYLISLQKDTPSPFVPTPKAPDGSGDDSSPEEEDSSEKVKVSIDFEGITERIKAFPVPEGIYQQVWGVKDKVLFSSLPVQGSLDRSWRNIEPPAKAKLEYYDFEKHQTEVIAQNVTSFKVARHSETLAYRAGNKIRVLAIGKRDEKKEKDKTPTRESGWIDLSRVKVEVIPDLEWKQMFREIWRLQRDHYWSEDMAGIDWNKIYDRYLPLLDKIATRAEFSDLVWELQGELGTSHAYELGGDYREPPHYRQGFLGSEFVYQEDFKGYEIKKIITGDPWDEKATSPLNRLGAEVQVGDVLLAINGKRLSRHHSPGEQLVNLSGQEVNLTVITPGAPESREVTVKAISSETLARYRDWVEANRKKVEKATNGQVGYLHIPDMGPQGYAEFHRYYMAELGKKGLIVDVRFNGGGHVSQLILEKLARKRVGYDVSRWGKPDPYPSESLFGPVVALTNEHAGSDGDIFSHCFKLMNLGKLIGKRTWGGVVGIWPRHRLVDGSITTQPEFSFWFVDVGWGVENYGTDPDIEVDIAPQDWVQGRDSQLEKGLEEILKDLEENPPQIPDFSDRPYLGQGPSGPESESGSGE